MTTNYSINHFSLSLPETEVVTDIPQLLEHLAATLRREYKGVAIQDIIFHLDEEDENRNKLPSVTVYYYPQA